MYTCRECERPINQATEICPYCGADLTEPIGPEAEEPAKKALSKVSRVKSPPAPTGFAGGVRNYFLLARPGNYGYRNFYPDESGVLRATRENRPATAQDPAF